LSGNEEHEEIMLAQEESVVNKVGLLKEVQGTLILTDRRLIFVTAGKEAKEDLVGRIPFPYETLTMRYADVEDLSSIPPDPSNFSILLDEIELDRGSDSVVTKPTLRIKWKDENGMERSNEFMADSEHRGRKVDLANWSDVINRLKDGSLKIRYPKAPYPKIGTLEGKILYTLGDMQEKGSLDIEEETEEAFKIELEPDDVDEACRKLVSQGFLDEIDDPSGDNFYRKRSPLGEDDLSS
jgi:hypothetical protein